ncbi:IS3 family transposase [Levilactobacillus namurensis]|uniref:IS3 family transposase n=1 Tax=Levilactobacillus namurensis TaxID=380393 RepID=A0AAW8W3V9_9LACO|nr:IS3 family transposase [Levilactobacillus namurensis]MDT7013632.1 IS3 family transposase [Levilactobacillus namurensis]MDT7013736.1 IS3 family transposase [Levilactobacillus namurensis]MDT7013902.1 IS3 family transposase [Levilactobacillus namurensis]MDT7014289.1 IS3 family transposase [Levilactobacillus namurensis]MDT7014361.1 IS3 family transposase [Levilactobacillus namurensis]
MTAQHKLAYQSIQEIGANIHGAQAIILRKLGLSRQAYHQWLHCEPTPWAQQEESLKGKMTKLFKQHRQRIGAGKMKLYLEHDESIDFYVSLKRVKRLMTVLHFKCQSRIKKHHRVKQEEQEVRDNVLNQQFDQATKPNQVWLSDSTEVRYGVNGEHKVRLCGVLDLHGRYLLAYYLSPTETSEAMIETFDQAFQNAGDVHPLVHTDRGSAFTSKAFNGFMTDHQVIRSMSRPGTPYDNAPIERWWNEFKLNWLASHPMPKTEQELIDLIEAGVYYFNYIDRTTQRNGSTANEYRREAA